MLVAAVNFPLAQGKPLLLLPARLLVRWPDATCIPQPGTPYTGPTVTVTRETAEKLRVVLFSPNPLARCDAAKDVPLHVLAAVCSYPHAKNLNHVARHLCPVVRAHIQAGHAATLKRLFFVAFGKSPEEQVARWNQSLR